MTAVVAPTTVEAPPSYKNVGLNTSGFNLHDFFGDEVDLEEYNEEYIQLFIDNGYDKWSAIKILTEDNLVQMGITKMGHRNRILHAIQQYGDRNDRNATYQ